MASRSSGDIGAPMAKNLRVLLPSSCGTLRIPEELAAEIGAGQALVVLPTGTDGKVRVWPVDVGRDGDGAFLGGGWPEFAEACGVEAGWLLVLRHRARGVLTVKAFDASRCLGVLGAPTPSAVEAAMSRKDAACKPQFISVLATNFMEKMLLPTKFVQQCISKELLNNLSAIVLGPIGKVHSIKLEMTRSDVFFAGGWSQFLAFHDITEANALRLRYEGNTVFTVEVFGFDGCQRESKHKEVRIPPNIEEQQEAPSTSIQKYCKNNLPIDDGGKKRQSSTTPMSTASFRRLAIYEIGPPSWIEKQINTNTLEKNLALPKDFCDGIGLRGPSTIMLKTSMDSTKYWEMLGMPCKNGSYQFVQGWRRFCQENCLKEGDICTFNVIESTMWHAIITRYIWTHQETSLSSSRKQNSRTGSSGSEEQKKRRGSITSVKKASLRVKCTYEIVPPAWIRKEMTIEAVKRYITFPAAFCNAIGIEEACMITLKTPLSSTRSWQVRILPYKHTSHQVGSGWRRFCLENKIMEGDVCTFNVIHSTLWHVTIVRR